MKNRFYRTLAVLTCLVMALLALCAGGAAAEGKNTAFLGNPFPEFTATDTEGNTFTLSEALKDHEAVLINLWATWCGPCLREFPLLNEVYKKYSGRVAFIALSIDSRDTVEDIAEYRKENGVLLPMGRDEGEELYGYISATGVPDTVVVDRFGTAVFYHDCAFNSADEIERVLESFLGDGYTQTKVLDKIPRDASTQAFPVSAARALYPDSGDYRKVLFHMENIKDPVACWIVPDEAVIIRMEVAADDDVTMMMYGNTYPGNNCYVKDLLDAETGTYCFEQLMPLPEDEMEIVQISLYDAGDEAGEKDVNAYLVKDEGSVEKLAALLKSDEKLGAVTWEYAETDEKAENALQAYIIHVVDQDNNPVEGVAVNFCTDTACVPQESDENGTVTYTGAPNIYHIQIVDAPEGYSWDESYEMYTTREYGEWVLRVRKD